MMNHTPGPWVAQGHEVYGPSHPESKHPNGRVFVASVAQGTYRADPLLCGGEDRFGFDSEADVRLIAAAPELLETLEEIIASNPSILAKARKVIRKARGRERLDKEYLDSRRVELRRQISVLEEQLAAERRVLEERQGELFS